MYVYAYSGHNLILYIKMKNQEIYQSVFSCFREKADFDSQETFSKNKREETPHKIIDIAN